MQKRQKLKWELNGPCFIQEIDRILYVSCFCGREFPPKAHRQQCIGAKVLPTIYTKIMI